MRRTARSLTQLQTEPPRGVMPPFEAALVVLIASRIALCPCRVGGRSRACGPRGHEVPRGTGPSGPTRTWRLSCRLPQTYAKGIAPSRAPGWTTGALVVLLAFDLRVASTDVSIGATSVLAALVVFARVSGRSSTPAGLQSLLGQQGEPRPAVFWQMRRWRARALEHDPIESPTCWGSRCSGSFRAPSPLHTPRPGPVPGQAPYGRPTGAETPATGPPSR